MGKTVYFFSVFAKVMRFVLFCFVLSIITHCSIMHDPLKRDTSSSKKTQNKIHEQNTCCGPGIVDLVIIN